MPLRCHFARPGHVALVLAVLLAVLAPALVEAAMWWPLLASLVVLGLPHGAVDHHVPGRVGRRVGQRRFAGGYLAVVAVGLALWWVAPAAGLALFLVVAAAHWGAGDVWFARYAGGRARFGRPWRLVAFVAARGMLPVLLPLLAFPEAAAEGTGAVLATVGGDPSGWAPQGTVRALGLVAVGAAVLAAMAASVLDHDLHVDRRPVRLDCSELVLLAVTFAVVPPVFAVGTYFAAWHSTRHVARLMASSPAQAARLAAHRPWSALAAWHREAAPLTVVCLAGLGLLAAVVWQVPSTAPSVAGAALALIAALTYPHALVVAWMDRVQLRGVVAPRSTRKPVLLLAASDLPRGSLRSPGRSS